jgi:DNA-binding GntR family transcriptional regulator
MEFKFKIQTNSSQAASVIRQLIISGEFKPGVRLRESELTKSLGISRSPIREAFRILESEGLLQIIPNKGASVTKFKEKDLHEIYELRALLESHGIRLSCKNLSQQNLEELKALIKEMEEKIISKDYSGYLRVSNDFHELYMKNCGNERLFSLFKTLRNNIMTVQIFARSFPGHDIESGVKEHKTILNALLKRDPDKAEMCIKKHLEFGLSRAKKYMRINGT